MAWQFVITDLNGNALGEVTNASTRQVSLPHQRIPVATFDLPTYDPLANTLLTTDTLLKCYRIDPVYGGTKKLVFHGPVVTAEESADGTNDRIMITASGPLWRLTRRIIPASKQATGAVYGTVTTPMDLGLAAHTMLSDVNAANYTGISIGTRVATSSSYIDLSTLVTAGDGLSKMHAALNSFEFEVVPIEATASSGVGGWPTIGTMNVAPIIGVVRDDAVFEFGTTRSNVQSYTRTIGRDTMVNQAIVNVNGWPTGSGGLVPITRSDTTSVNSRGLFEEVVDDGGIADDTLRSQLGDFQVTYRKDPKVIVVFRPATNATPSPLSDYFVGDSVRARASINGNLRFDNVFRVWGISFGIDENGNEGVDLELVMPT